MKVFICWSGDRGSKFASACREWIVTVVAVNGVLSDIRAFIEAKDADFGGQIRRVLTEIEALVHRPPAGTVG
jgi:hypothetical protein